MNLDWNKMLESALSGFAGAVAVALTTLGSTVYLSKKSHRAREAIQESVAAIGKDLDDGLEKMNDSQIQFGNAVNNLTSEVNTVTQKLIEIINKKWKP